MDKGGISIKQNIIWLLKEISTDTYYNMDEACAKWKKPATRDYILYCRIPLISNVQNRQIETENGLVIAQGWGVTARRYGFLLGVMNTY